MTKTNAWRNAIFAVFFLSGLSVASWVARLPDIRDFNGLSTQGVGLVILSAAIGSIVGLVVAPVIMARFGARRGMISALTLAALGLVLIGVGGSVVTTVAFVVAGLILFGFGNGAVDVMMNVEGAAAERAIGRTVMPLMHAFFSLGTVAGAGLGAGAAALNIPVAPHLGVVAVVLVSGVVTAVRYVPTGGNTAVGDHTAVGEVRVASEVTTPRRSLGDRLSGHLAVWADLRLILIGMIMLGMSFAEGAASDWIALATVDGHNTDNEVGALVFTVFTVGMTVARIFGGPLLDRFGRVPVLRVLAGVAAVGLLLFIFGTEPWMYVTGTLLWAVGCSLGFPVGMSAAADGPSDSDSSAERIAASRSAARVSAVAIIGYCAFLAGPPLLGFLGQHFGILNALIVILVLVIIAGLLAPAVREREFSKSAVLEQQERSKSTNSTH